MKQIAHLDLNAFFVQVEELKDDSLIGKPVAVGGKGPRGVLSTANYVARAQGCHSGMPTSEARRLCPKLIIIDGHYSDYSYYSNTFMDFLKRRFKKIQQMSIDECYIDMSDLFSKQEAHDYLRDLQLDIFKTTHLKCSIGLGENRFLAKMGSDYQKPLGITVIYKEDVPKILWPLSISKMYMIGAKTYPRLEALGIKTIGDLAVTQDPRVKRALGSSFLYQQDHANGIGNNELNYEGFDPKSVSSARTFDYDTSDEDELRGMVKKLARSVAKELKKSHKKTDTIVLSFRTPEFVTRSKRMKFSSYSNDADEIVTRALIVYDRHYNGAPLRLIGVGAADVQDEEGIEVQLSLFQKDLQIKEDPNQKLIFELITDINKTIDGANIQKGIKLNNKKPRGYDRFHPENKEGKDEII